MNATLSVWLNVLKSTEKVLREAKGIESVAKET